MRKVESYRIDKDGYYVEKYLYDEDKVPESDIITPIPNNIYPPYRWTGQTWVGDGIFPVLKPTEPTEMEVLRDYVLDLDFRLIMMEFGL